MLSPETGAERVKRTNRVNLPPGVSIVETVRAAMLEHPTAQAGAKAVGIDRDCYAVIRKIVSMRDDPRTPEEDRDRLDEATATIDATRRVAAAKRSVADLIAVSWHSKERKGETRRQSRRLEQTLVSIRENCESTRDLVIPRGLSAAETREAVLTLVASVELIARLARRLAGDEGEET